MDAIHFKFTNRATPKQRRAVLGAIEAEKAKVRPQFPGVKDRELAAIHVVEGKTPTIKKLLSSLNDTRCVEYVEKRPKRRLVS